MAEVELVEHQQTVDEVCPSASEGSVLLACALQHRTVLHSS